MFISGRGRVYYIIGVVAKPKSDDPLYKMWKTENKLEIPWLINFMTNDVGENFILYERTQEIFDAARESYSDKEDTTEAFKIEGILHDLRQLSE